MPPLASVRRWALVGLVALAALAAGIAVGRGGDEAGLGPTSAGGSGADHAPARPKPVRFTVAATGDFLIHSPVFQRALANGGGSEYDFRSMFRAIEPYIEEADLAICHIETPMAEGPPQGYPLFNTPATLARAVAATGWDVCETASNHALDQGQSGIDRTGEVLDRAGLPHTGSFSSAAGRRRPLIVEVEGVRVALLAYTEMTNGIPLPHRWSVNLARPRRILADARAAREAGAELVIVNLHAGDEYQSDPSSLQRKLARRLTASPDVDAVLGQHVHVVQPIERVGGKPVVFGEGNLVSNQTAACCAEGSQDGLVALLDFVIDAEGVRGERVRYVPVFVSHPDYRVLPIGDALEDGIGDPVALRASYRRTRDIVGTKHAEPVPEELP